MDQEKLRKAQEEMRVLAYRDLVIPKEPDTKLRDEEKRAMVIAIEAFAIWQKFDPSRFINVATGKPMGVKPDERFWRIE